MFNSSKRKNLALTLGLLLWNGCAVELEDEESPELAGIEQSAVAVSNGLRTINGLRTVNGLITANGLTTTNGLRTVNGLRTINGLRTVNGMRTVNGLDVDCTGKTVGVSCTGSPNGILSSTTGMMKSADGVNTAKYLVRCALPKGDKIQVKSHTGALVELPGELGLASGWKDGQCDATCQERVSACLMAFTNGDGAHIDVEMSAPFTLGTGHSSSFPYQEAAFYGNLFLDPPQAFYCVGEDYAQSGAHLSLLESRACVGYNEQTGSCPYVRVGYCNNEFSYNYWKDKTITGDEKCSFSSGETARSCKSGSSSYSGKTWSNPITTFRKTRT